VRLGRELGACDSGIRQNGFDHELTAVVTVHPRHISLSDGSLAQHPELSHIWSYPEAGARGRSRRPRLRRGERLHASPCVRPHQPRKPPTPVGLARLNADFPTAPTRPSPKGAIGRWGTLAQAIVEAQARIGQHGFRLTHEVAGQYTHICRLFLCSRGGRGSEHEVRPEP